MIPDLGLYKFLIKRLFIQVTACLNFQRNSLFGSTAFLFEPVEPKARQGKLLTQSKLCIERVKATHPVRHIIKANPVGVQSQVCFHVVLLDEVQILLEDLLPVYNQGHVNSIIVTL